MHWKNQYKSLVTILFFSMLVATFTPVIALHTPNETNSNKNTETKTATQNATQRTNTITSTPKEEIQKNTTNTETKTKTTTENTSKRTIIYKGEISATPSAIGKLLVKTETAEKNVDTDKATKVLIYTNRKTPSTVAKLKINDKVTIIGKIKEDNASLIAQYILVNNNEEQQTEKRHAAYGTVSSREASGSAFILQITKPNKNETKSYLLNNTSIIKVKGIENPKLSDIKIGDRVTFTYSESKSERIIKKIYAIPGRGADLLRDIRESNEVGQKTSSPQPTTRATATPNATVNQTPKSTPITTQTATPSGTKKPSPTPNE